MCYGMQTKLELEELFLSKSKEDLMSMKKTLEDDKESIKLELSIIEKINNLQPYFLEEYKKEVKNRRDSLIIY